MISLLSLSEQESLSLPVSGFGLNLPSLPMQIPMEKDFNYIKSIAKIDTKNILREDEEKTKFITFPNRNLVELISFQTIIPTKALVRPKKSRNIEKIKSSLTEEKFDILESIDIDKLKKSKTRGNKTNYTSSELKQFLFKLDETQTGKKSILVDRLLNLIESIKH